MEAKKARHRNEPGGSASARSDEERILEVLRDGYEAHDAQALSALYADDAEYVVLNRNYPPSKSLVLRGRDAIGQMLTDVCSREMTHRIDDLTEGDGAVAFTAHCSYPDGCKVVALVRAQIADGRIVREINVSCWDE
jgi:ketosteroid isomerase-like protein